MNKEQAILQIYYKLVRTAIFFFLYLILIQGCRGVSQTPLALTPTKPAIQKTGQPTLESTKIPVVINTPKPAKSLTTTKNIPSITPTSEPVPKTEIKVFDFTIYFEIHPEYALNGVIVYEYQGNIIFFNPATGNKNVVPGGIFNYGSVSPEGQWFAVRSKDETGEFLAVFAADGDQVKKIPFRNNWFKILGWVNDKELVLIPYGEQPVPSYVYNPFDNTEVELRLDFPFIYNISQSAGWVNYADTGFIVSPNMNAVVFPHDDCNYVMWDLKDEKVVNKLLASHGNAPSPQWSLDGTRLITLGWSNQDNPETCGKKHTLDIYLLTLSGAIERLTYLSPNSSGLLYGHLSWSPDERFIAFWLRNLEEKKDQIIVYDREKHTLKAYPEPAGLYFPYENYPQDRFVWSPNSQQLLAVVHDDGNVNGLLIIDVIKDIGILLPEEDIVLYGWMKNLP